MRPQQDGFEVVLDGRPALTPARERLVSMHRGLAEAIAAEWEEQREVIDPAAMPLTQRRMLIIDRGEADRDKWADGMRSYLQSDLLCYRAEDPEELVRLQEEKWTPYLEWASKVLSIPLRATGGIIAVNQPPMAEQGLNAQIAEMDEEVLCCLAAATEITGSVVLALALFYGAASVQDIFDVSRLDETWQAQKWGQDAEAMAREARLRTELVDIARYLELISGSPATA